MSDITIEPYDASDADEVLAVINDAFDEPRSSDWFQWKHLDGPWGPSRGVVARDDRGMVGVRLLLPWRFVLDGQPLLAYRAVEASTVGRAQGQGVFSRLNRSLMEDLEQRDPSSFMFSTPNLLSRNGYRKLGWTWLEPVAHGFGLARRRRVEPETKFISDDAALNTHRVPGHENGRLRTDWDIEAMRWRIDTRTGNDYRVRAALSGTDAGGVVYRIIDVARTRAILVIHRWGRAQLISATLGEVSRRERVRIVLDVRTPDRQRRFAVRRGESLLTTWTPLELSGDGEAISDSSRWQVTFADLESVL